MNIINTDFKNSIFKDSNNSKFWDYNKQIIVDLQKRVSFLEKQLKQSMSLRKLKVPTQDAIYFINYDNLMFLNSKSNYTYLYLNNGSKILAAKTLNYFVNKINDSYFFRVHASYFVNLKYVSKILKSKSVVLLENGKEIPISRNNRKALDKIFN